MAEYANEREKSENEKLTNPFTLGISDRMSFIGTHKFIRKRFNIALLNAKKVAFVGSKAPNVKVMDLNTRQPVYLLDYQRNNRPLVLNFGNCT